MYIAFLCDVLRKARALVDRPVVYAVDPGPLKAGVDSILGDEIDVEWRKHADDHFGRQAAAVPTPNLIVCADLPTLPVDYLAQAADRLGHDDVVLGPSIDGGVYLFGLRRPAPELFEGDTWADIDSTEQAAGSVEKPHLFTAIRARAAQLDLTTRLLPPWYRIDTVDDLRRLSLDLENLPSDSVDDCPFTRTEIEAFDL